MCGEAGPAARDSGGVSWTAVRGCSLARGTRRPEARLDSGPCVLPPVTEPGGFAGVCFQAG